MNPKYVYIVGTREHWGKCDICVCTTVIDVSLYLAITYPGIDNHVSIELLKKGEKCVPINMNRGYVSVLPVFNE